MHTTASDLPTVLSVNMPNPAFERDSQRREPLNLNVEAVEKPKSTPKNIPRSAIISLQDKTKVDGTWRDSNRYTKA